MLCTTGGGKLLPQSATRTIVDESMTGKQTHPGGVIEFGPKRLEPVPYVAINELQQVRTTYENASIMELASAIESDHPGMTISSGTFELANPLLMGVHTKKSAKQYISDYSDYYRIPRKDRFDYQNLTPLDDDRAAILIAGHRRRRAIGHLLEKNNIPPVDVRIHSNIHDDITFSEAIGLQLRENVYERPAPQDEARAIDLLYQHNKERLGKVPNIKKLAAQIGFSETKVRDALTFASLPDSIQEYTTSGALSYSVVRQLRPLYDAFLSAYRHDETPVRLQKAELSLKEFCDTVLRQRLSGKSDEKISRTIANRTSEIAGQADYQQLTFDLLVDEHTVERRTDRAGRQLAATAIAVMRYRLRTGEVKDSELDELEALVAARRAEQAVSRPVELPLGLVEPL